MGGALTIGYTNEGRKSFIYGFSIKGGTTNNSSFLKAITYESILFSTLEVDGSSQVVREEEAYLKSDFNATNNFLRVNFDWGNNLGSERLLYLIQGRIKIDEGYRPSYNLGAGVFLLKKGAPLEVKGGIQIQATDLFGYRTDANFGKRLILNFVAATSFD